jgi:hypothetical protein
MGNFIRCEDMHKGDCYYIHTGMFGVYTIISDVGGTDRVTCTKPYLSTKGNTVGNTVTN